MSGILGARLDSRSANLGINNVFTQSHRRILAVTGIGLLDGPRSFLMLLGIWEISEVT